MLVLSGLIGAIAGAAITFFFNMWKFHRDERSSRCDELCKSIHDAAVLAADYWFDDYTTKPQEIAEAKLYAAQILIDGQFSSFRLYLRREDEAGIDHLLSGFYDALTGGNYSVPGRSPDITRGRNAIAVGSLLTIEIRKAHRATMPFHRVAAAYHTNRKRELDMPRAFADT